MYVSLKDKKIIKKYFISEHGGWSLWSSWSSCPVSCGEGERIRKRTCDSPKPLFGGNDCEGSDTDQQTCKLPMVCPSKYYYKFINNKIVFTKINTQVCYIIFGHTLLENSFFLLLF